MKLLKCFAISFLCIARLLGSEGDSSIKKGQEPKYYDFSKSLIAITQDAEVKDLKQNSLVQLKSLGTQRKLSFSSINSAFKPFDHKKTVCFSSISSSLGRTLAAPKSTKKALKTSLVAEKDPFGISDKDSQSQCTIS